MATLKARRLVEFDYKGRHQYSITICTHNKLKLLVNEEFLTSLIAELKDISEAFNFQVWAYCFMPNHLHLLIEGIKEDSDLKKFISAYKQKTGYSYKMIHRKPKTAEGQTPSEKLWQPSYYDHVLRNEESLTDITRYIANNPVRKGLVQNYLDYPFSGSFVINLQDL